MVCGPFWGSQAAPPPPSYVQSPPSLSQGLGQDGDPLAFHLLLEGAPLLACAWFWSPVWPDSGSDLTAETSWDPQGQGEQPTTCSLA